MGPYNVHVRAGGPGLVRPVPAFSHTLEAEADGRYTLSLRVEMNALAGLGDVEAQNSRFLGPADGHPLLRYGSGNMLTASTALPSTGWHSFLATSEGATVSLSVDGSLAAHGVLPAAAVAPRLSVAPAFITPDLAAQHFGGDLVGATLLPQAADAELVKTLSAHLPDLTLLSWNDASLPWPWRHAAITATLNRRILR